MERIATVNPDLLSRRLQHRPGLCQKTLTADVIRFRKIVGGALILGLTTIGCVLRPALAEDEVVAASPNTQSALTLQEIEALLMDVEQIPQVPESKNLAEGNPEATPLVTDDSLSVFRATTPSLWWQERQTGNWIGTSRLVTSWAAYDQIGGQTGESLSHIDLNINGQIWNLLNYLEQYAMIHQFGQTAKSFGYQLRLFNGNTLAGGYICNFSGITEQSFTREATLNFDVLETVPCRVSLDYLGRGGIRGSSNTP